MPPGSTTRHRSAIDGGRGEAHLNAGDQSAEQSGEVPSGQAARARISNDPRGVAAIDLNQPQIARAPECHVARPVRCGSRHVATRGLQASPKLWTANQTGTCNRRISSRARDRRLPGRRPRRAATLPPVPERRPPIEGGLQARTTSTSLDVASLVHLLRCEPTPLAGRIFRPRRQCDAWIENVGNPRSDTGDAWSFEVGQDGVGPAHDHLDARC